MNWYKIAQNQPLLFQDKEWDQTENQRSLYERLVELKPQIAQIAQKEYDAWEIDEDGFDSEVGAGGICQEIAREIGGFISEKLSVETYEQEATVGEQHVWTVAYNDSEAFMIDIPYSVYESGGGYSWQKIPNVKFTSDHILIEPTEVPDF